jgi:hypothetical protein
VSVGGDVSGCDGKKKRKKNEKASRFEVSSEKERPKTGSAAMIQLCLDHGVVIIIITHRR